jgi:hypothetical protein
MNIKDVEGDGRSRYPKCERKKLGNSAGNLSKNICSPDPDFNPETPKYEAGILPTGKPCAVSSYCSYGPN